MSCLRGQKTDMSSSQKETGLLGESDQWAETMSGPLSPQMCLYSMTLVTFYKDDMLPIFLRRPE
jgi:hypothetical protein